MPPMPIPMQEFVRHAQYSATKISPDGRYLALTMLQGDNMSLAVLRMQDMQVIRITRLTDGESVGEFYWVGPNRLMYTSARNFGTYASPFGTGEWYAMDADGGHPRTLVSYAAGAPPGARRWSIYNEMYSMLDPLPDDESKALMQLNDGSARRAQRRGGDRHASPAGGRSWPRRRATIAKWCSMRRTSRGTRTASRPRMPKLGYDEHTELYRLDGDDTWSRIEHAEGRRTRACSVVGTAADGRIYALASDGVKPAAFGILDPTNDTFHSLYQDPVAGIHDFLYAADGSTVVGVVTMAGAPHVELVERQHPDAKVYAALSKAFPGELVDVTSATRDGKKIVVTVYSDTDPGQLYLYDRDSGNVRFLMKNRPASGSGEDGARAAVFVQGPRWEDACTAT